MIFEKTVTFNLWIFLFSEFEWHQWLKWFAFWQLIQTFRFIKKLIIETKAISDHHDRFFLGANFYQGHQRIQMVLYWKGIEKDDYNYDQLLRWPNFHLLSFLLASQPFRFISLSDREPMSQCSLLPPVRKAIVWPTKYKTVRHKLCCLVKLTGSTQLAWFWSLRREGGREHVQLHFLIIYQGFGCCLVFPCWSLKAGRRNGGGSKVPTCVDLKVLKQWQQNGCLSKLPN